MKIEESSLTGETQGIEKDGNVTFLHKVKDGAVDKSYGIHVAQLAGLPRAVLREATKLLKRLEAQGSELAPVSQQLDLFAEPVDSSDEEEQIQNDKPAMTDAEQDVLDDISNLYLADKTPLQIMQMVADWQKDLKDDN